MKQKICQVCGAEALVLNEWKKEYKCRACDAVFGIEDAFSADAEALNDLQDAERLLQQNPPSFDYAETQFDLIIRKHPTWSAGYWGRLRAKFGIKYEIDYSGKSVPSCYMSTYEDIRENEDFHNALRYASPELKRVYEEQAARIADVARVWHENAGKYNYDVFISFKETDDTTHGVTSDRQEMLELYNHLTMKGYKVFFSPVSLHQRDIYGAQSEPYIFDAIDDAKIMIVYGSKAEYFNSTWVQNEWQRYYLAMGKGKKAPGSLIVAYEGFNAIELPNVLRKTQAVDAHSKHFHSDILDLVEKFCKPEKGKSKQATEPPKTASKKTKTGAITCPECGGNFSHEDLLDGDKIVTCLTCGKSFLTSDIIKENNGEGSKKKTSKRELSSEELRRAEERATKFKKGKFSKVIICCTILFSALSVACFTNNGILAGTIALVASGLFLLAYLLGIQVLKKGNSNLHIVAAILAFSLFIPYCIVGADINFGDNTDYSSTFEWQTNGLFSLLPEPDTNNGKITRETEKQIQFELYNITPTQFDDYVKDCRNNGFTENITKNDDVFYAKTAEGYDLAFFYYEDTNVLKVSLDSYDVEEQSEQLGDDNNPILSIDEFVAGFEKAEFAKFNSFASENGLGGSLIYIEGTLDDVEVLSADGTQSLIGTLTDSEGNKWLVLLHCIPLVSDSAFNKAIGEEVVITCEYDGFSGNKQMPFVILDELLITNTNEIIFGMKKVLE